MTHVGRVFRQAKESLQQSPTTAAAVYSMEGPVAMTTLSPVTAKHKKSTL